LLDSLLQEIKVSAMLGQLNKLFGFQPVDTADERGEGTDSDKFSKRQVGDNGDASSSKKVRVEESEKKGGNSLIYQKGVVSVIDESGEEATIGQAGGDQDEIGQTSNVLQLREEMSGLEEQLATATTELKFLHSSVSSPILCCICRKLPRSLPLYSCNSHHKLCSTCSSKQPRCPICSKPLYQETSPMLTALLSSLSRHCSWSHLGCSYHSRLEQLEKHEQICKYQAVFCWGCQASTPLHTFDQHDPDLTCFSFNRVHKSPVIKTMLNTVSQFDGQFPLHYTGDVEWNPLAIKHAGKMFFLRIKRIASRGVWVLYTAAQLLPGQCLKYLATITLSCPNSDINIGSNWTYTGAPSSLVVGLDKVVRKGNCLLMTDPAMEQVMTICNDKRGTLFTVRVEIVGV